MFQFRRFPTYGYLIHHTLTVSSTAGFPHSEIHGSLAAFASPWLIVDRYVLHRLPMPRHSPCALISLTFFRIMCPFGFVNFTQLKIVVFLTQHSLDIFVNFSLFPFHITCIQFSKYIFNSAPLNWWARVDSNHRPHAYQACALTT